MNTFFRYIYAFALAALLLMGSAASCVREDLNMEVPENGKGEEGQGVDLMLAFSMDDFQGPADAQVGTRAEGDVDTDGLTAEQNVSIENISSLAVFILDEQYNMVAYRVISPPDGDTEDNPIWFMGKNPTTKRKLRTWTEKFNYGYYNVGESTTLEAADRRADYYTNDHNYNGGKDASGNDVTIESGDIYAKYLEDGRYYKDDQHYGCWIVEDGKKTKTLHDYCVGYNGFAKIEGNKLAPLNEFNGVLYPDFDDDGRYDDSYAEGTFRDYNAGERMRKSPVVIVTFKYDNPMHGVVEKLKRGNYYVAAIANFRESLSSVDLYTQAGEFIETPAAKQYTYPNDFAYTNNVKESETPNTNTLNYVEDFVYSIARNWDPTGGTDGCGLTAYGMRPFFQSALSLSELHISEAGQLALATGISVNDRDGNNTSDWKDTPLLRSSKARIISTGFQPITLTPGNTNIYQFELKRIVARSTFEISNYSDYDLTVTDFRLSDNFVQGATTLFATPSGGPTRFNTAWQASPDVTNDASISGNTVVTTAKPLVSFPKTGGFTVPGRSKATAGNNLNRVMFDALSYESGGSGAALSYDITVAYQDVKTGTSTVVGVEDVTEKAVNNFADLLSEGSWATNETRYYLFQNTSAGFMYKNGTSVPTDDNEIAVVAATVKNGTHSYVWGIEKVSGNTVRIKNIDGQYLRRNNTNLLFDGTSSNAAEFTVGSGTNSTFYVVVEGGRWETTYYLRASDGYYNSGNITFSTGTDRNEFSLYPVTMDVVDYMYQTLNVPVEAFKMSSGIAEPLNYLYRNQHLKVHIGVTYNTQAQTIDFHVEPWKKVNNYVEFE